MQKQSLEKVGEGELLNKEKLNIEIKNPTIDIEIDQGGSGVSRFQ